MAAMRLHTRIDGDLDGRPVVIVHGITQHGGPWEPLAQSLAADGAFVVRVDLRGHGGSGHIPPWNVAAHVDDLLETVRAVGIDGPAVWIGHSLGGYIVASLAAAAPDAVERVVLLDPAMALDAQQALLLAENDRLDWSFATVDEAVDALLAAGFLVATPRETLVAYATDDMQTGPDGRLRFSFCPSAAVTAWSEMTLPAPPVAAAPTLLVRVQVPLFDTAAQDARYRDALGGDLVTQTVPNGHNVQWESIEEITAVIRGFLAGE
jgi:lipase